MKRDKQIAAILDVFWNERRMRSEAELEAELHEWPQDWFARLLRFFGKYPPRPSMVAARLRFDQRFGKLLRLGFEHADKIKGKITPTEIYPVNADVVDLSDGTFAVEMFITASKVELVKGFKERSEAAEWIKDNGSAFALKQGARPDSRIYRIGTEY